ncbi:type II restriction endonuclease subunit M [Cupriavidus sp. DF5525]|uniref:type II restriction endonuclease subunit M n=1 Tax=Cupriavidus sp. DF5525 TaxID=3160989 RepID=UPI0032DF4F2B
MAVFLRILEDKDKEQSLCQIVSALRQGKVSPKSFECSPDLLREIPGAPFSYWISGGVRAAFRSFPPFESAGRVARQGLATADDSRFVRTWWETKDLHQPTLEARVGVQTSDDFRFVRSWWESHRGASKWLPFAKGGAYSPIYGDIYLVVNWAADGQEVKNFVDKASGRLLSRPQNTEYFLRPGLTWSLRTKSRLSMRVLPAGCAFSHKGPGAFCEGDDPDLLMAVLGVCSTPHFYSLVEVQLAAADAQLGGAAHSFEVGVIQRTPLPPLPPEAIAELSQLVHRAWNLSRLLRSSVETSRDFLLPACLLTKHGLLDEAKIRAEIQELQQQIDRIGASLYGFTIDDVGLDSERRDSSSWSLGEEEEDEDEPESADESFAPLSWAVGVAFGRFVIDPVQSDRGQRALQESVPFEPMPSISPGMVGTDKEVFHRAADILVDDPGHTHDLTHLVEEVLLAAGVPVPDDVRRWLHKEFFAFHLQRYSKSRRKAPIYWPLTTTSGSYTLWVYYPSLSSQTLYTAINDFVEPKLKQVGDDVVALRNKGVARSRDDEQQFESLQTFELELIELRDTLLKLAPTYKPNHDDGVQISAAPLWSLFRHKPWQKVLKDTWAKLEKGDYDWAHLAMNYWLDRVREKCKTDKSLAIAHGLEDLYVEPEATAKKARGNKKTRGEE